MKYRYLLLCLFLPLFSHAQQGLATSEQYAVISKSEMSAYRSYFSADRELRNIASRWDDEGPGSAKMKKGRAFMVLGGLLFSGGVIFYSLSDHHVSIYLNEDKPNGTYGAADLKAEAATLTALAGVGFFVPGVIMYSKGKKQLDAYKAQKTVSLNMAGAGLSLRLNL